MPQVSARFTAELVEEIDRAASRPDRTRAEVIRQAVEYYLDDFEDLQLGLERLQDPSDPILDWEDIKAQKMVSIRLEADDYKFLSSLAEADKEDLSTAVRDLIARGRLFLALERYREGKASLAKAAEVAGVSVSEMMDFLAENGAPADLTVEDYRESLLALREIW